MSKALSAPPTSDPSTASPTASPIASPDALSGGFADASFDSAHAFRTLLDVMARPGLIGRLMQAKAPAPASPSLATALLTLCDGTTPLFLAPSHATPALKDWIAFHVGAPLTADPAEAVFAAGSWDSLGGIERFAVGSDDYPDRSTTVLVETEWLANEGLRLTGPGIATSAFLNLPQSWLLALQSNHALYPQGVDCFFCCEEAIAALPRSTRVEAC